MIRRRTARLLMYLVVVGSAGAIGYFWGVPGWQHLLPWAVYGFVCGLLWRRYVDPRFPS